jgi:uncharacterized protein YggE
MKSTVKILCIGAAAMAFAACVQNSNQNPVPSYVEIVGTAEKEVEPDIFYLSFSLNEADNAKKTDINVLEKRMLAALQAINIDTKNDLTVTGMSSDDWYWWRKRSTKYQRKSYSLKINQLDFVEKTCDILDSLKISYYLSKVDYSEMDELKKEVQQEAVKAARQKAENLLSGENKKVNELIYLQEENQSRYNNYYEEEDCLYAYTPRKITFNESAPAFKKINLSYSVIARFSIK